MIRKSHVAAFSAILSVGLLISTGASFANEFEIGESSVFVPGRLGKLGLSHDGSRFNVTKDGERVTIPSHWTDKNMRNISQERLAKFLEKGYLSVNQMDNGEYTLKANVRGNGGGPILGQVLGWGVRIGSWSACAALTVVAPHVAMEVVPVVLTYTEPVAVAATVIGTGTPTP